MYRSPVGAVIMADQTTPAKSTVVVVPGSFSPSILYSDIIDQLSAHGYEAVAVNLPSVGRRNKAPPATMTDDANHIRSVTIELADQGKEIVLVMHSYGGIAGTESAKGLARSDREAEGKIGGIISLVYLTAIIPRIGSPFLIGPLPDYAHVIVSHQLFMLIQEPF
jgi:pimeloyl-ACP methyl ester carboxylesterase